MNRITNTRCALAFCALALTPMGAAAASNATVAADSEWYVHANLLQMRTTPAGQSLYTWIEDEVIEDLTEEFGFDIGDELDGVTVFGSSAPEHDNAAVILHGFLSTKTRDAILDRAAVEVGLTTESDYGRDFYRVGGNESMKGLEFDGGYLAFGDSGQTLVTGNREMLDAFLAADAHFVGAQSTNLITIQAETALLHGAVDAAGVRKSGGPFDSHMFQNVERLNLSIDDNNGLFDIQIAITATDETMAMAIQNIIQGLISLKAMDGEDPEARALLENLTVSSDGADVRMQLLLEPETVVDILD